VSAFFIHRPIFASVLSIVIVLAGLAAMPSLPVAEYPQISPPTVMITATYPGASAQTLANTVAAPIEQELSGIEGLSYFSTSASTNGTVTITVTFQVGTDVDMASVNVNNRVRAAEPRLPEEVRRNGVLVAERSSESLMVVAFSSTTVDRLFLSNYVSLNVVDELLRLPGVGEVIVLGAQDYSMRIWLDPDRMAQRGVTASDIAAAIRQQNTQNAAGRIGQEPAPESQRLTYAVTAKGRLATPEQFGDIVLRSSGPGGVLRLQDVARVELGSENYDVSVTVDGHPDVGINLFLQSGANALDTSQRVHRKMAELARDFPEGVSYSVPIDNTESISASIGEVSRTLVEAALLVVVVVYLFLQSWRATLLPMIAVPVSLIGAFAGLWAFGFSINTLTMFGLVLSIGIVVDDAIIVLENVERLMTEKKLSARDAALEAMREVSGVVVASVLVLAAAFVPVAFLGGMAGELYRQFAMTVTIAVMISGVVALTLTPALCAVLLDVRHAKSRLFVPFDRGFAWLTERYVAGVRRILHHPFLGASALLATVGLAAVMLRVVPVSFVPLEDQGRLFTALTLPDGASFKRAFESGEQFRQRISAFPEVDRVVVVSGRDLIGDRTQTNVGTVFVKLRDWSERDISAQEFANRLMGIGMSLPDAMAVTFNPPPIMNLGSAGGFELYVQSRKDDDLQRLHEVVQDLLAALRERPEIALASSFFRASAPQLYVEVDEPKALALGIPLSSIYQTLQSTMGSLYVNDFNLSGRVYRVQLQAEPRYRQRPEDLGRVYVRSETTGAMIPLSAVSAIHPIVGAEKVERFNGFLAAKVMGAAISGVSSGDAMRILEQVARDVLPSGYAIAWTGQAYEEQLSSGSSYVAFGFGIVMVFLILAAQYEKWRLPIAVLLAVPFAVLGALALVFARGMPNDIYFQIGLVVLIGLAAKNAILIVEFAAQRHAQGLELREAAAEAARLRFRPILMTSLAFILGVLPLVFSTGAGAAARRSMGTGVFGGMIAATFVATLFVPLFFTWLERGKRIHPVGDPALDPGAAEPGRDPE
jgi:HAE1 family hydrophobic/amphiphilic exporter-1/multidrug efflux pump